MVLIYTTHSEELADNIERDPKTWTVQEKEGKGYFLIIKRAAKYSVISPLLLKLSLKEKYLCSFFCGMSPATPPKVSKPFDTKKKRRQSDLCEEGEQSCSLIWRTSRHVVLGLRDICSLTHFECKGYKYHFCYSSAGQDLRNTGQSTKEFSPHSKFP